MTDTVTSPSRLLSQIDMTQPLPYALLHADEHLTAILYRPQQEDGQTPHDQDEFYFVASGQAQVRVGGDVRPVQVGDAVFVPALADHRFENISEDFSCWAIFFGPKHDATNQRT